MAGTLERQVPDGHRVLSSRNARLAYLAELRRSFEKQTGQSLAPDTALTGLEEKISRAHASLDRMFSEIHNMYGKGKDVREYLQFLQTHSIPREAGVKGMLFFVKLPTKKHPEGEDFFPKFSMTDGRMVALSVGKPMGSIGALDAASEERSEHLEVLEKFVLELQKNIRASLDGGAPRHDFPLVA